jgi:hypothetical protein
MKKTSLKVLGLLLTGALALGVSASAAHAAAKTRTKLSPQAAAAHVTRKVGATVTHYRSETANGNYRLRSQSGDGRQVNDRYFDPVAQRITGKGHDLVPEGTQRVALAHAQRNAGARGYDVVFPVNYQTTGRAPHGTTMRYFILDRRGVVVDSYLYNPQTKRVTKDQYAPDLIGIKP